MKNIDMDATNSNQKDITIKASDLRGILEYVPIYRNQTFVIAIDGSVIDCANFPNLVTDIAVLRSLGINVVVVHGIGHQLKEAGKERGIALSDIYGNNPVDAATLALAREVSASVLQTIVDTFTTKNLKCATTNAVRTTEIGIISGVDYKNAGRIDKIDFKTLENLLSLGMIPILTPMAVNREGRIFRINSDLLAAEVAAGLGATKLIYMTVTRGLMVGDENMVAVPFAEAKQLAESRKELVDPRVLSKVQNAIKALESARTQRAHILDGREFASLLTELFEKVGCGTMIYADEYQKIRPATRDDLSTIFNISRISSSNQNLVYRTMEEIGQKLDSYYVYEMDGSIIAFVSLIDIGEGAAELASLHVQPFYQGNDVGTRMVEFIEHKAKKSGYKRLFALSTKSAPFFGQIVKFSEVSPEDLPKARYEKYLASGRHSKVFVKEFV